MEKKKDKKSLRINLSIEDLQLLDSKCKERGLDRSNYIRETIRGTNSNHSYSVPVKEALNNISAGVCFLRQEELSGEGKEALNMMEGGIRELWRCLR